MGMTLSGDKSCLEQTVLYIGQSFSHETTNKWNVKTNTTGNNISIWYVEY